MDSRTITSAETNPANGLQSGVKITPQTISVSQLLAFKKQKVKPIDLLNVPGITIPPHLISKKRHTEATDTLTLNIRMLFNSLTTDNLAKVKKQLREIIVEKAKNAEMIEEISQEVLSNFIISEQNIKNYMHLLNAISAACVLMPHVTGTTKNVSPTIGNHFLGKCKDLILRSISDENIRKLAATDLDDPDQLDIYNREREKIINLIITICFLYEQRNTTNIKLTAIHLFDLIKNIMNAHDLLQARMRELGNPYEEDCSDEEEYELCRKMCSLYAEHLYTFMSRQASEFNKDDTDIKGHKMIELTERFRNEIVPLLSEAYLISKCDAIKY